jgi:putative flavoprotein involved in K+ transport
MTAIDTVVIGAGHAGLAVSRLLTEAGRDHVVLDRGEVAERWRTERWDSLHLLTPNWMTRLPGHRYTGPDTEGFMPVASFIRYLEQYAASFDAPVQPGTTVLSVRRAGEGYRVETDQGTWRACHVVVATGPWGTPRVPDAVSWVHPDVLTTTSAHYRNPRSLPDGGVLVVGGSSAGVQIADELARAGRDVVLATGRHSRMPRRYRGMDIFWWLEQTGRLSRTIDTVPDRRAARREPSLQLVGRGDAARADENLDLAVLRDRGVTVTGRLTRLEGFGARFGDDLDGNVAAADRQMNRFLDTVDRLVDDTGLAREVWAPDRPAPVDLGPGLRELDLRGARIGTVLLASGYRPHHPWLHVPVLDDEGAIEQRDGVTAAPGLYVVGQRFQRRRDSGFIDGARHDARIVVDHLLAGRPRAGYSPRATGDPR